MMLRSWDSGLNGGTEAVSFVATVVRAQFRRSWDRVSWDGPAPLMQVLDRDNYCSLRPSSLAAQQSARR